MKCKHFLIAKGPDFNQDIRGNGHLELPLESSLVIIAEACHNYLDRPLISPSGPSSIDRNTLQKLRVGLMQCLRMAFGSNIVFQLAAAISDRPVVGVSQSVFPNTTCSCPKLSATHTFLLSGKNSEKMY